MLSFLRRVLRTACATCAMSAMPGPLAARMRALVVLGALLLASPALHAATWWVSTSGNDSTGNGGQATPYRTLSRVFNGVAQAGDTVNLVTSAGNTTFNECNVRPRVRVTLQTAPGNAGMARIHCDIAVNGSVTLFMDPATSGSIIRNLELSGGYYYAIQFQTAWEQGVGGSGASNILVEDVKIHDTGRDGIKITPKCENITIRRAEIYNSGVRDNSNAEGIDNVLGNGMLVEDSYIHDIATNGIYFKGGARNVIIQRNRIENAGGGVLIGFDTDPEFFDLTENPDNYEALSGIVRNNIIRNTRGPGIGLYASRDSVVVNNTIVNPARVSNSGIHFGVSTVSDTGLAPPNFNPFIRNNIVLFETNPAGRPCMQIVQSEDFGSALNGVVNSNYNAFHNPATGCRFRDDRSGSASNGTHTFAAWRTASGNEINSMETALTLTADAHLPAGSPAINAGQTVAQVSDDFDRQTRVAPFDIGADEVVNVTPVACDLDLDGDGVVRPLSDGLLLHRYVINTQANVDLTQHARTPAGTRPFAQVQSLVEAMRNTLAVDVDGDGVVDRKDSTLIFRALSGLTGAGVTSGLSFAGSARSQWSAIRTWLNAQCSLALP